MAKHQFVKRSVAGAVLAALFAPALLDAQDESVNPGINKSFQDPDPKTFVERFEREGREVYDNREVIVEKLGLKQGMTVADVGCGTGLFTRLIAPAVGSEGKVYAVDIAKAFVDHTVMSCRVRGAPNVEGIVCTPDDARLPENSVDLVFICDTFHHFEFPINTMRSILRALKPGGRVVLLDFERIEGVSSDWIMGHVRAGKEVFRAEVEQSGFEFVEELDLFEENYFLLFRPKGGDAKPATAPDSEAATETEPAEIRRVVAVENVCAWPNLSLMNDGTVIAVFHNQPSHGQQEGDIDCWASRDGISWKKRSTITAHEPDTVRMNHAAGVAKNGDLVVLCSGWTNVAQAPRPKQAAFRDDILRAWVMRSADGGRSWEKSEDFPAAEAGWSEHIPFGDIWIGDDGRLHASTYQGKFKDPDQSTKTEGWRSWHLVSEDDGRTWKVGSVIGPKHNETDILPLGGDSWLAAARITQMDLIRSDDNGKTWQEPVAVTGRNEINGHLARLEDGRLLLSYGVRVNGRRGVCAKLSADGGKTWGEPLRLAHTADGGDCGYPSSVQLADGSIVTAWYSSDSPEHSGYHLGVSVWSAPELVKVN